MLRRRSALAFAVLIAAALAAPAAGGTPLPQPRSFTITAAGDIIMHGMLQNAADAYLPGPGWDFKPMVAEIEPWISPADLAICHLESTMSATNTGLSGYPRFVGPRELTDAIVAAGWDGCSVASNHAMDSGFAGVTSTLDLLDEAGVGHTGTARTEGERGPVFYDVNGVRVAHISATFSTNGIPIPAAQPFAVDLIDTDRILADAARAREQGSEFTFVSLHWGTEYNVQPTSYQLSVADRVMASPDVDLILGHHAHVVQPIGMMHGKYVVYGMGNHLSNQFSFWGPSYYATEDGLMVHVSVSERSDGSFGVDGIEFTPTWVSYPDYVVHSAADVAHRGGPGAGAARASFDRTVARTLSLDAPNVTVSETPWPEVSCEGTRATILGTPNDDTIVGTPGLDVIAARGGNDVVDAGDGPDIVCGGLGDDVLDGGPGRDLLFGGPGRDRMFGDLLDLLIGDPTRDVCSQGEPHRTCIPG